MPSVCGGARSSPGKSGGSRPVAAWLLGDSWARPDDGREAPRTGQGAAGGGGLCALSGWHSLAASALSPAPLPQVREGRVWQVQRPALLHPAHGLRVCGAGVRQLPRGHHGGTVSPAVVGLRAAPGPAPSAHWLLPAGIRMCRWAEPSFPPGGWCSCATEGSAHNEFIPVPWRSRGVCVQTAFGVVPSIGSLP